MAAWEWDLATGEIRWSAAVGPQFGLAPGVSPAGVDAFLALVHPDDRELVRAGVDAAIEQRGAHELRFRAHWPDGTDHWLQAAGHVLADPGGEPARYVAVMRPAGGPDGLSAAAPDGERLFRQFAEVAPIMVWVADPDGACTFVSQGWLEFTGTRLEDNLGAGWLELLHPDDVDGLRAAWERARVTREPFELEYRLRRGDGAWRWVLDRGRPIEDPDGLFSGWVGGCVDLHERAESEEEARLLSDAGRLLAGAVEVEERLDAVAALAVPALGERCAIVLRPDAAPEAAHLVDGVPEDLQAVLGLTEGTSVVAPLVAGGRAFGVLAAAARPGRVLDVRELRIAQELANRIALALDGARLLRIARASEQASEAARSVLDTLIDQAPVGFAYFDSALRYVQVNRALCAINGLTEAEHLGKRVPDILPDVGEELSAALERVLATGESLVDLEVTGTTPADPVRPRHFQLSLYRIQLPGGGMIGVGATVVDVTERREAEVALRGQRDLYETLLRAQSELGEGFVLAEGERILFVNEATERIAGRSAEELYALPSLLAIFPPGRRRDIASRVDRILNEGLVDPGFQTEIVTPAGARVAIEVSARPLVVEDGPQQMVILVRDIADRRRQELERERLLAAERAARRESELARDRAAFLADVSGVLERSMELSVILQQVAERMAGTLADVVTISVLTRDGQRLERAGAATSDVQRRADVLTLRGRIIDATPAVATAQVSLTGQPRFYPSLSDHDFASFASTPEVLEVLRRVLGRSVALVPLTAGGRSFGVLALTWDEQGHVPADEDRRLLDEVARRLALAIDNAQLYAERAHIASTLQASLLPPDLPVIPGVEAAARYLPAGEASEVGGDFYDLYGLGEGSWAIMVGDVCGKGAEAAAVTAMARYTLRAASAAAAERPDPAGAFHLLNRQMCGERVPERFLTAVLGRLIPREDRGMDLLLACAGHPAPIVLRAGGEAVPVAAGGPLLGVDDAATWAETRITLDPGDAIVFYTDGVTEALRTEPLSAAELAELLPPGAGASAEALADAVRDLAHERADGPLRDDVAIVALRLTGAAHG